jgi:hypothetical protein
MTIAMKIMFGSAGQNPVCTSRPTLRVAIHCLCAMGALVAVAALVALVGRQAAAVEPALPSTAAAATAPADSPAATMSFADYLATWKIDRSSRAVLEERSPWNAAKQDVALRVLARLTRVPATLAAQWNADAVDLSALASANALVPAQRVQDRLVNVEGRATFVATVPLSEEQAEVAGRRQLEVVRIVSDAGMAVDIVADHVPKAWPRDVGIDEPAAAIGLPLAEGPGPAAIPGADGSASVPAAILLAARSVAWFPPTPFGALGMDYGLFDFVVDGQKLAAGDTEAFYAALAAVGRAAPAGSDEPAVQPGDIVPLINPGSGWFAKHRGEPFTVEGVARRATRIEVDDPLRRRQLGTDHYWELYVFVRTPLLKVHGRLQEDYPVVCCVRTLPAGMPSGQQISERVRVSGFAFKRYGYPLPDVKISSSQGDKEQKGQRQETALLIGNEARWRPAPRPTAEVDTLGWIFLAIAAVIGIAIALAAWSFARDSRRRDRQTRRELPDRIDVP